MKEPPIHQAVLENRPEEVKFLLESGHPPERRNRLGLTPLELARLLGRKACEARLHEIEPKTILVQQKRDTRPTGWTPDEFHKLMKIPYFRSLRFRSYETLKLVIKSCPYILRLPFLENRQLRDLYADELKSEAIAPCSIRWIDEHIHYGLFAEKDFDEGEWVGEYTGVVREYVRTHPDQNAYCLHYPTRLWSLRYFMVDAYPGGNELRFANHSDDPNMNPQCLVKNRLLHTVLMTSRKVQKGEELTFNYGKDFWRKRKKLG